MANRPRRLSVILHADLAGYVRLMEGGEDRTVDRLKTVRAEVWRPACETGGGSVVNIEGDSVLAEFGSALAAVATAIDIQERMASFNGMLEPDERLMFRIGLHLGEVIVDEETNGIFGDGVNLAARIQAMAEPGGIAVSRALRDIAEVRTEYDFVDGGEHWAKNVSRPLQIYHVRARAGSMRTTTTIVPQTILRFHGTDHAGKKYAFDVDLDRLMTRRAGLVIGRDVEQCDIVVAHSTVSRRHARLLFASGALQIEDLGSMNGTAVDGAPARRGVPRSIQTGARLTLGEVDLSIGGE
ncbi:MAG: FHA domain-containing protein [Reyranella sp.]|uniref:FHA domain-containing protein n=1 Tax=Reyranella sp. TaxID=1929291 RepID=UPI003D10AB0A